MGVFDRKTFCIVTGASRGYGKTLAELLAARMMSSSVLVLTARSSDLLEALKQQLSLKHPSLHLFCWLSDLETPSYQLYSTFLQHLLKANNWTTSDFEQCLLVHNGGTLGALHKLQTEMTNPEEVDEYWRVNITSVIILNAAFLSLFSNHHYHYVINISSTESTKSYRGWTLYCTGKAAREQLFKCLAVENPGMKVLSWCPGALHTDMLKLCLQTNIDEQMKQLLDEEILSCEQSALRLMRLLQKDSFESHTKLGYYDLDDEGNVLPVD